MLIWKVSSARLTRDSWRKSRAKCGVLTENFWKILKDANLKEKQCRSHSEEESPDGIMNGGATPEGVVRGPGSGGMAPKKERSRQPPVRTESGLTTS